LFESGALLPEAHGKNKSGSCATSNKITGIENAMPRALDATPIQADFCVIVGSLPGRGRSDDDVADERCGSLLKCKGPPAGWLHLETICATKRRFDLTIRGPADCHLPCSRWNARWALAKDISRLPKLVIVADWQRDGVDLCQFEQRNRLGCYACGLLRFHLYTY
jgi:hypothetical protein